jgi:hypothetical protein
MHRTSSKLGANRVEAAAIAHRLGSMAIRHPRGLTTSSRPRVRRAQFVEPGIGDPEMVRDRGRQCRRWPQRAGSGVWFAHERDLEDGILLGAGAHPPTGVFAGSLVQAVQPMCPDEGELSIRRLILDDDGYAAELIAKWRR